MKISYCITACNEHIELEGLLRFLKRNIREEDEVIIQLDSNATNEVHEVCNLFTGFNHEQELADSIKNSKCYQYPLNNDFATFKNELSKQATGDYIFQIDADEIPNKFLVENLHNILENNESDIILVPRVNYVRGITPQHLQAWGWKQNEQGWVQWPDHQWRIYKNIPEIKWKNKLHEVLDGFKTYANLPELEEYALYHYKSIERQEKQNNYYNTL
jgi:hypothetical protein